MASNNKSKPTSDSLPQEQNSLQKYYLNFIDISGQLKINTEFCRHQDSS